MRYQRISDKAIVKAESCQDIIEQYYSCVEGLSDWVKHEYLTGNLLFVGNHIFVKDFEGKIQKADHRDCLVKQINGELSVVKAAHFKKYFRTMERVLELLKINQRKKK